MGFPLSGLENRFLGKNKPLSFQGFFGRKGTMKEFFSIQVIVIHGNKGRGGVVLALIGIGLFGEVHARGIKRPFRRAIRIDDRSRKEGNALEDTEEKTLLSNLVIKGKRNVLGKEAGLDEAGRTGVVPRKEKGTKTDGEGRQIQILGKAGLFFLGGEIQISAHVLAVERKRWIVGQHIEWIIVNMNTILLRFDNNAFLVVGYNPMKRSQREAF